MGYALSEKDKENPENEVLTGSPDFKVQNGSRKCTDILFLLMLCAAWAAMTILGFIVTGVIHSATLEPGNPQRLINGIDYNGRICGVDSEVKERTNIYYVPSGDGVCVESCPTATNYTQFICFDEVTAEITNNVTGEVDIQKAWTRISDGKCLYHMVTTNILGYCMFDTVIDRASEAAIGKIEAEMEMYLNETGANYTVVSSDVAESTWFEDLFADILTAKGLIGGFGLAVSAVIGTAYLMFLRIPGVLFVLIWGLVWSVWFLFAGAGVALSVTSDTWAAEEEPRTHDTGQINAAKYLSYIMFVFCALWVLLMLWFRKRIKMAIAITKEAARAVNDMKVLILFPMIQSAALLVFLTPWLIFTLYLASSGEISTAKLEAASGSASITVKTFTYTDEVRYTALYMLFTYFWTSEFIVAMGQIVVAMAVATWYFTRDKKTIGSGTVFGAISTSMFYHSGTAAFGSLIIAIIKTIRAIVAYIQKKTKNTPNKILQAVLCCVQCCLWCLEKCMKFLNKNAYIQTAIFGYSFCTAAKKAFFLIARNIMRVAAVGVVSEIVLILGKVLIPLVSTLLFYICADASLGDELHGLVGISVLVFMVSFFVATMFTEVFGMAISTILQCFIADEEMFKGDDRYGQGDLADMLDKASRSNTKGEAKVVAVESKADAGEA